MTEFPRQNAQREGSAIVAGVADDTWRQAASEAQSIAMAASGGLAGAVGAAAMANAARRAAADNNSRSATPSSESAGPQEPSSGRGGNGPINRIGEAIIHGRDGAHPNDRLEGMLEQINRIRGSAVEDLDTRDTLVRLRDGRQMLIMPGDQGTLTINADGSYSLNARGIQRVENRNGVTTVTMDNSSVSFDQFGILSVSRGKRMVSFARPLPRMHDNLPPSGMEPLGPSQSPRPPREREAYPTPPSNRLNVPPPRDN